MAVPVISIVGSTESGKTTLIEKLIPAINKRGYRVGTIKHAREIDTDVTKDSQRHLQAGSEVVVLAAPGHIVMIKPTLEPGIEEIRQLFDSGLDLIICEGFKSADLPKIEVYKKGQETSIEGLTSVIAVVSEENRGTNTRQYKPEDTEGLVDLLERGFIQPQSNWFDLYINGKQVPLTVFPRQIIRDVIMAMVGTLKSVDPVETLEIRMKKEQNREMRV